MPLFRALRVHQVEKDFKARLEHIRLSDLSVGEVVIRVAYSSLNYKDALEVCGKTRIMRNMPFAGIDLSGVVHSSADPQFKPGDQYWSPAAPSVKY
jgi:NADPH2:quinone reductase